jgi:hypothetical protein
MVKKSSASKVEKNSICNAKSNESIARSVKKYVTLPQPCMSQLIIIANEDLKKARLENKAGF